MKLVVFGASGQCGTHLVRLAAAAGHAVTAVVRASTAFTAPDGVRVTQGDVLDPAFVARAVLGHDAVASCLGMRYRHPWARRDSPDDFTPRATQHLVSAMQAQGLKRLAVISAAGVGDSRPALNWPMRVLLATSNVGVAYAGLERTEDVLRESALDWVAVRPTTLTQGPREDRVVVTARYRAWDRIAREDVAAFLLRQLEAPTLAHRTPMITGGG